MDEYIIAAFILGLAAGIGIHRLAISFALTRSPDDICSYCAWFDRKNRHRK